MRIIGEAGRKGLARVFLAEMRPGLMVEFVDACDPAVGGRDKKWVIVVSSQYGCPVGCLTCDAGGDFRGNLSAGEIISQVEQAFKMNPEQDPQKCRKLKVQFARMGEPALNDAVVEAIRWLAEKFPRAIPCIATMAPAGRERWFASFLDVSRRFAHAQLQFSMNTTDPEMRDRLIPYPKMGWPEMVAWGEKFYRPGSRRPSLNFALSPGVPVQAARVAELFDPAVFAIKLTPLNPTATAGESGLQCVAQGEQARRLVGQKAREFAELGYQVIESVGNMEENDIGSNCGQMVRKHKAEMPGYQKAPA